MTSTFTWRTCEGLDLRPDQMDTLHLFHIVRLIWNHTVPETHQIKPFRQWNLSLDADEREEAMVAMLGELASRPDKSPLTGEQRAELMTIRLKDKIWKKALKDVEAGFGPDDGDYDEDAEQWARDELHEMGDR